MNDEKRMAGDYEIIHAMHIGDQEIVVGESPTADAGQMYMCAFCEQNEIYARYDEVLCSDDYAEIIGISNTPNLCAAFMLTIPTPLSRSVWMKTGCPFRIAAATSKVREGRLRRRFVAVCEKKPDLLCPLAFHFPRYLRSSAAI